MFPPQYGHVSAVVGINVPQYLHFTLATSRITTCSEGFEPKSILDSHGVGDEVGGGTYSECFGRALSLLRFRIAA